jgi:hypothetical protein
MILLILMSMLLGTSATVRTENVNGQTEAAIPTLTVCEAQEVKEVITKLPVP